MDLDVTRFLERHKATSASATIALYRVDDPSHYGVVPLDDNGRVKQFIEKPPGPQFPSHFINSGCYALEPSVLDFISDGEFAMFERARPSLERINDIFAIEFPMVSRELKMGGTADIIAKFDGIDSIIDLKSSTRPKELPYCEKFFLQETAYSIMFEELTSRPIEQLVTIIANEKGTVQVLIKNRDDFTQELKQIIAQYQKGRMLV